MRKIIHFDSNWIFSKTAELPARYPCNQKDGLLSQGWEAVNLPHTWNAADGQDGGNDYWRGTAMYCKRFSRPEWDGRVFLECNGAAMTADVYLNGKHLTHHEGGYSTFRVELTDSLQEENLLCIAVDNGANDRIYPQKADFTFYGGLYRSVNLICVPEQHFELVKDGTPGIRVTPVVEGRAAVVQVETWVRGQGEVVFSLKDSADQKDAAMQQTALSENGYAKAEFTIENAHLWDGPEDPYLYIAAAAFGGDEVSVRFGCRTFGFDAEKGFLLNGRVYPLRGVSRHQDRKGMGNALTSKEHREDMEIVREIGANTLRLAHYQHAQEFYDLCDEYGIIVWAEIPYITRHMPNGRENTVTQMRELITQCYNHPSICCWGLSNEITASGTITMPSGSASDGMEDLMENHRILNELCHRMDKTRPTTMAHVFMLETDSPMTEIADIGSYNLYFGWYLGELEQNDSFFDDYHAAHPDRIMGFSEYGADANPRFQSAHPEKGDYSESYQCIYHEHLLKCIEERPWLWATHVWNLFDFGADGRDEGGKGGENQKGLVTFDRSVKKDAFYLYKAAWSRSPFVHLCGRRYVDRAEEKTEIKVYSNQREVSLYVDGREYAQKEGERIFIFEMELSGEHIITAKAGECMDVITIRRVETPNPDYCLQGSEVVNWFDADTFDPTCFSIKDTLGTLTKHPGTAAIVGRMMEAARATRGDVAAATAGNANLEKMMAGMSLQSLLKQAGPAIKPEQIQSLNAALQRIPKDEGRQQDQGNAGDGIKEQAEALKRQPLTRAAAEQVRQPMQTAIYPGRPWRDTCGRRIQAHGGALFYEDGIYYWYGENKDRTDGRSGIWTWGIRAYTSVDLYNWEDLGLIIEPNLENPASNLFPAAHVDRPHILKCDSTGKYVCWIKISGDGACFTILQADAFRGPYRVVAENYRPFGMKVGDFDMVKDEGGKAYLFMDADHKCILGMELSEDFLTVEREISRQYEGLHAPFCREGVALFKRGGKRYMLTSGMSGYIPNKSDAAVSDSWADTFVSIGNPHVGDVSNASFNSQISQVFKVPGKKDLYISIADRWVPGYPVDAARADMIERAIAAHYEPERYQIGPDERRELMGSPMLESADTSIADYVWLPLAFDGDRVFIRWEEEWKIEDYE